MALIPEMDVPKQLLGYNQETKKWTVHEDVCEILQLIKIPIVAIATVGSYRTGKSYFQNRLAGRNSGFELGPALQGHTKGIWIWALEHPKKRNTCMLLLDTEGFDDAEKSDKDNDIQIFTLAILLSSCFIFNTVSKIDDALIKELHLVTEITEQVKVRADQEDETGSSFSSYFPKLVILLRDVFLEFKINGKEVTPKEYLEHVLKAKPGLNRKAKDYNAPRDCIRLFFPERYIFALPRPVDDEEALRTLDQDHVTPKESFEERLNEAIDAIFGFANIMKLSKNQINGIRYVELCRHYVEAMNAGKVPCLLSAVEIMVEKDCERATKEAISAYSQTIQHHMDGGSVLDQPTLEKCHKAAHTEALALYEREAAFDKKMQYKSNLQMKLDSEYERFKRLNSEHSVAKTKETIARCFASLEKGLKEKEFIRKGGYANYQSKKAEALGSFTVQRNLGPAKDTVLSGYLMDLSAAENAIIAADEALSQHDKERIKLEDSVQRAKEEARLKAEQLADQKRDAQRKEDEFKTVIQNMEVEWNKKQQDLAKDQQKALDRMTAELEAVKKSSAETAAEYERMIEDLRINNVNERAESKKEMVQTVCKTFAGIITSGLNAYVSYQTHAEKEKGTAKLLDIVAGAASKGDSTKDTLAGAAATP